MFSLFFSELLSNLSRLIDGPQEACSRNGFEQIRAMSVCVCVIGTFVEVNKKKKVLFSNSAHEHKYAEGLGEVWQKEAV